MTLLVRVAAALSAAGIRHALIGATALALRGIARSTYDFDLLAIDERVLDPETWADLVNDGIVIDIRKGDADDPLRGVVRLQSKTERPCAGRRGRGRCKDDARGDTGDLEEMSGRTLKTRTALILKRRQRDQEQPADHGRAGGESDPDRLSDTDAVSMLAFDLRDL